MVRFVLCFLLIPFMQNIITRFIRLETVLTLWWVLCYAGTFSAIFLITASNLKLMIIVNGVCGGCERGGIRILWIFKGNLFFFRVIWEKETATGAKAEKETVIVLRFLQRWHFHGNDSWCLGDTMDDKPDCYLKMILRFWMYICCVLVEE